MMRLWTYWSVVFLAIDKLYGVPLLRCSSRNGKEKVQLKHTKPYCSSQKTGREKSDW